MHLIQLAQYDNSGGDGGGGIMTFFFGLFWIGLIIAISVWVKGDSQRNQIPCFGKKFDTDKDPMAWAILCFFCCFALLYYFYRRSNAFQERGRDISQEAYLNTRQPTFTRAPKPELEQLEPVELTLDEQLETIHRLKEKGLITEAEWQQKKKQLLGL